MTYCETSLRVRPSLFVQSILNQDARANKFSFYEIAEIIKCADQSGANNRRRTRQFSTMHKDSRGYFYRTFREDSGVRRQYLGQSRFARRLWDLQKSQKQSDADDREAQQLAFAGETALEQRVEEFAGEVEIWRRFVLLQNGFRQRKRGEWRRQRGFPMNEKIEDLDLNDQKRALLIGAQKNREGAQKFLAFAENEGTLDGFLTALADLGVRAQSEIIKRIVPSGDPLTLAAFGKKTSA